MNVPRVDAWRDRFNKAAIDTNRSIGGSGLRAELRRCGKLVLDLDDCNAERLCGNSRCYLKDVMLSARKCGGFAWGNSLKV